jgi:hypothetical protein
MILNCFNQIFNEVKTFFCYPLRIKQNNITVFKSFLLIFSLIVLQFVYQIFITKYFFYIFPALLNITQISTNTNSNMVSQLLGTVIITPIFEEFTNRFTLNFRNKFSLLALIVSICTFVFTIMPKSFSLIFLPIFLITFTLIFSWEYLFQIRDKFYKIFKITATQDSQFINIYRKTFGLTFNYIINKFSTVILYFSIFSFIFGHLNNNLYLDDQYKIKSLAYAIIAYLPVTLLWSYISIKFKNGVIYTIICHAIWNFYVSRGIFFGD